MPSDAARKMKRIEIIDQKVPGQKDMFAPVTSGVLGQMTRCPCGFGLSEAVVRRLWADEAASTAAICATRRVTLRFPATTPS